MGNGSSGRSFIDIPGHSYYLFSMSHDQFPWLLVATWMNGIFAIAAKAGKPVAVGVAGGDGITTPLELCLGGVSSLPRC